MGFHLRARRPDAPSSRAALRGHSLLCLLLRGPIYLSSPQAVGRHGLLFRSLSDAHLHLPLLHRIYEGRAGGFRAAHGAQYGPVALHTLCHYRHRVYAQGTGESPAVVLDNSLLISFEETIHKAPAPLRVRALYFYIALGAETLQ